MKQDTQAASDVEQPPTLMSLSDVDHPSRHKKTHEVLSPNAVARRNRKRNRRWPRRQSALADVFFRHGSAWASGQLRQPVLWQSALRL